MAHPFEVSGEIESDATPEQAWEAVTTGQGLDAWFMGTNDVEPRLGGAVRTSLPGFTLESTITVWDPPHRFVSQTPEAGDGRLTAFEYLIEGRGGRTVIRFVHSGFLPGEDWETEYDALKEGDPAYLFKLGEYLRYFRGRVATPVQAFGGKVGRERAWELLKRDLGLKGEVAVGQAVKAAPEGLAPIDGVVDFVSPAFLGVRTSDGIYRFIHGFEGSMVLGHHIFSKVDREATERAWQNWLDRLFA
jgi:uncharacterized protein YndB with AHSA1/START domain